MQKEWIFLLIGLMAGILFFKVTEHNPSYAQMLTENPSSVAIMKLDVANSFIMVDSGMQKMFFYQFRMNSDGKTMNFVLKGSTDYKVDYYNSASQK